LRINKSEEIEQVRKRGLPPRFVVFLRAGGSPTYRLVVFLDIEEPMNI
jgi:hypothetical protein